MSMKSGVQQVWDSAKAVIRSSPLMQNSLAILIWRVLKGMARNDATHLAAGLAYYALFSLFPFLLGFLALMGLALDSEEAQQNFLAFVTNNLPGLEEFVTSNVTEVVQRRGALGIGAVLVLIWVGVSVFGAISRAVNRVWEVDHTRPFYIAKPLQLVLALVLGALFLFSTAASSFIQLSTEKDLGIPGQGLFLQLGLAQLLLYLIPWVITLTIFLFIYWFVPYCKTTWRYIWPGALTAGLLFEGGKFLFVWYLKNLAIYTQVYGSLASVIALLFWAYISSLILILGAQISVEYERLRRPMRGDGNNLKAADGM